MENIVGKQYRQMYHKCANCAHGTINNGTPRSKKTSAMMMYKVSGLQVQPVV
jgi:hypothetical protein